MPSIFKILLIIGIAFFIQYLIRVGVANFIKQSRRIKRAETISQIIHSTTRTIIIVISIMMILNELGIDIRPMIAGAGILGLAVSFGAQNLTKDVINGFLILLEDQYGVSDKVKIGDMSGTVEKMNLRTTTLKDQNGNVHIIPNGEIKQVTVLK